MRRWTPEQREKQLQRQRDWYYKKRGTVPKEKELPKEKTFIYNPIEKIIHPPLFEILDTLRKDNRHYLCVKSVKQWTDKDWNAFYKLKNL